MAELKAWTNKVNFVVCRDNLYSMIVEKMFKYTLFPELSRKCITFFLEW